MAYLTVYLVHYYIIGTLHGLVEDFTCVAHVTIKDERCSRCLCFKTHTLRL